MIRYVLFLVGAFALAGCSATQELKEARRINEERIVSYSPLYGESDRLLPRIKPQDEEMRAMPRNGVMSHSVLSGEKKLINTKPGKKSPVSNRKSPNQSDAIVSYSPLWGEAFVVPRDRG